MVPSLSHNIKSQTHSRVSECDGRPSIQVQPSSVNRMVSAPSGVQTDLSEVVHTSCKSICHSSEPQTSTVRISNPRHQGGNKLYLQAFALDFFHDSSWALPHLSVLVLHFSPSFKTAGQFISTVSHLFRFLASYRSSPRGWGTVNGTQTGTFFLFI